MSDYANVVEMFEANAKRSEMKDSGGNTYTHFSLAQSEVEKYAETRGVTKAIINSVADVTKELYNGGYEFAAKQVLDAIELAKKEGKDPAAVKIGVTMYTCQGPDKFTVVAKRVNNSLQSDTPTIGYGALRLNIVRKRCMDKVAMEVIEKQIQTALGE